MLEKESSSSGTVGCSVSRRLRSRRWMSLLESDCVRRWLRRNLPCMVVGFSSFSESLLTGECSDRMEEDEERDMKEAAAAAAEAPEVPLSKPDRSGDEDPALAELVMPTSGEDGRPPSSDRLAPAANAVDDRVDDDPDDDEDDEEDDDVV